MTLTPVPSLDQLAADPALVKNLPPVVAGDLLPGVAALHAALQVRALGRAGADDGQPEAEDRLLSVEEVASKMGVSKDYLYRHAKDLPFRVRLGSRLLFSERGIERWVRQRQGR